LRLGHLEGPAYPFAKNTIRQKPERLDAQSMKCLLIMNTLDDTSLRCGLFCVTLIAEPISPLMFESQQEVG
jgi:hypothetical protein